MELAFLFLFYELFGVVTNLLGGWLAAHAGSGSTLLGGLAMQVVALGMLGLVDPTWAKVASVAYVMGAQSLSGIAKDLTKMSAKSTIKLLVPENRESSLFKWVAVLTGSKNALKGRGFFLGGVLLAALGYQSALFAMAGALVSSSSRDGRIASLGSSEIKDQAKFEGPVLQDARRERPLRGALLPFRRARHLVRGRRAGLPSTTLGWGFTEVGSFLALWVVGYGVIQSVAPLFIRRWTGGRAPQGRAAQVLAFLLAAVTALIAAGLTAGFAPAAMILGGLAVFGVVFAINSSVHSYLILAYSDGDKVAMNVGFYYMANAGEARGDAALGNDVSAHGRGGLPLGVGGVRGSCGDVLAHVAAQGDGDADGGDEGRGSGLTLFGEALGRPLEVARCRCYPGRGRPLP